MQEENLDFLEVTYQNSPKTLFRKVSYKKPKNGTLVTTEFGGVGISAP
jgi:hypothetical protein